METKSANFILPVSHSQTHMYDIYELLNIDPTKYIVNIEKSSIFIFHLLIADTEVEKGTQIYDETTDIVDLSKKSGKYIEFREISPIYLNWHAGSAIADIDIRYIFKENGVETPIIANLYLRIELSEMRIELAVRTIDPKEMDNKLFGIHLAGIEYSIIENEFGVKQEPKKLFVSLPMKGKTEEEIKTEMNDILYKVRNTTGNYSIELIDSFITDNEGPMNEKERPIWYLGESIKRLSKADYVCFAPGWENARGCKIEHKVAEEYGLIIS